MLIILFPLTPPERPKRPHSVWRYLAFGMYTIQGRRKLESRCCQCLTAKLGFLTQYFQYNPNASVAGFQHWGHATSKDLYTWQNHPPAIAPANDTEGIFSGSAVLDVNNTSGFFDNNTSPETRFVAM